MRMPLDEIAHPLDTVEIGAQSPKFSLRIHVEPDSTSSDRLTLSEN